MRHGLAGFATVMAGRLLPGCEGPATMRDAGPTDAGPTDAGGIDAGSIDAGPVYFPPRTVPPAPALRSLIGDVGPLLDPDGLGLRLPAGFTARIVANSGELVPGLTYTWHDLPDGGATYATLDGGWIYVSNSELPLVGGVGALRFSSDGSLTDAYPILEGTNVNCAGGKTPWHTWLSCEEAANGQVYECDPWGEHPPVLRAALGEFKHEAAAVDPVHAHVYMTEDESDGGFYRFVPDALTPEGHPDLNAGRVEIAVVAGGSVSWETVPDPLRTGTVTTREQVATATRFRGGEGIWYQAGKVYFSTKRDDRVWEYDIETAMISVLYDGDALASPPLTGVDNVTVSCCGDVLVAEDGGSMQIVAILPSGELKPLMQLVGQDSSEITGPAFDPSGTRLYFSSQRGMASRGITYEVTGPFHEPA